MVLLLALLCAAAPDLVTKAGALYDSGRYEEAAVLYRDAGRRGEQPAISWFNYGNCQAQLKHRGEAAAAWRKALEWAPRFKRARTNLAILSEEDGQIGEAIAEYGHLWDQDPQDPFPAVRLAEIHLGQDDPAGAIEWFQKALAVDPASGQASEGLVRAHLAAQDTLEARMVLSRWTDQVRDSSAAGLFSRAMLWERTGDWESARRTCENALVFDSSRVDTWLLLARILEREGSDATASSVMGVACAQLPQEPRLWKAWGQTALRSNQPDVAATALLHALRLGDRSARDLLRQLAAWHEGRGETALGQRIRQAVVDSSK
jgi:Tfp pilus assembly protein PilF